MLSDKALRTAYHDTENGTHAEGLRAVAEAAVAADRAARAEPVAFMREGWGPDCGPFVEFYTADQMGSRDRDGWAALYTATPSPPAAPVVPEYDRNAYEELRSIIDGGSEIMTHADAVEWCRRHADADWMPVKTVAPVLPEGWKLVPVEPTAAMREDVWAAMLNAATPNPETKT